MSVDLVLRNRQRLRKIDLRYLRRVALATIDDELRITAFPESRRFEIGIHVVQADEMARLNTLYLQHDGGTDVITLEYDESERTPEGELWTFGDIFVCIDEAVAQARRFGTTWQSELIRYVIHGLLHLRGFDDTRPAKRRVMKREENRLLKVISRRFPLPGLAGTRGKNFNRG